MNKLMKENVTHVSNGNSFFRAPKKEPLNSFSKPLREIDRYPQSKKVIGTLNPVLEKMEI